MGNGCPPLAYQRLGCHSIIAALGQCPSCNQRWRVPIAVVRLAASKASIEVLVVVKRVLWTIAAALIEAVPVARRMAGGFIENDLEPRKR